MNKITLAYIAGIIDGEGHIGLYGRPDYRYKSSVATYSLRVVVQMTHRGVIEWLRQTTGVGGFSHITKHTANRKDSYHWRVHARQAATLLKELLPYLIVKREHAIIALRFSSTIRQGGLAVNRRRYIDNETAAIRVQCVNDLHALNSGGVRTYIPIKVHDVPRSLSVPYKKHSAETRAKMAAGYAAWRERKRIEKLSMG